MAQSEIQNRLNNDYFQAIGRVAAEWAMLERIIIRGINYIAFEYPWHANLFTSQFNNINVLLKIFDALLISCNKRKATMKKFYKLRTDINNASTNRNTIIHGHWVGYAGRSEKVGIVNYRKNKRLNISIDEYTPEDVKEIAEEIASISKKLGKFINRYVLSMPTLHERLGIPRRDMDHILRSILLEPESPPPPSQE